jgi:hypothetical protein
VVFNGRLYASQNRFEFAAWLWIKLPVVPIAADRMRLEKVKAVVSVRFDKKFVSSFRNAITAFFWLFWIAINQIVEFMFRQKLIHQSFGKAFLVLREVRAAAVELVCLDD